MITIALPLADPGAIHALLARHASAEVAAACEPGGYRVSIDVDAIDGAQAVLHLGSQAIALGPAVIDLTADLTPPPDNAASAIPAPARPSSDR